MENNAPASAHTSGPWKAHGPYTVPSDFHIEMKGMTIIATDGDIEWAIAHIFGKNEDECEVETKNNALLMAAAPDLLQCTKYLLMVCQDRLSIEKENGGDPEVIDHYELLYADAKKAIAKAEGRV